MESTEENFIGALINALLQKRIAKLLKDDKDKEKNKEESLSRCFIDFAPMAYGYGNYTIVVKYKDGKAETAMNKVLGMHKDILQNGFTQEEFDSLKSRMLNSLKNLRNARARMSNKYHFENIKKNFINELDLLDAGSNLKAFEKIVKNLSLEDIRARLNKWYSGPNKSITVLGGLDDELLTKQQVLDFEANCEAIKVIPDQEDEEEKEVNEDNLLSKELEGSKIVKSEKISEFTAEKWTLENGATVIYKECNANPEMVNIYAVSPGGHSSQNGKDLINSSAFSSFAPAMGIKGYTKKQFDNLLKTKQIKCFPKLTQRDEEMYLMCKYANIETAFQILYNRFENPEIYKDKFDEIYSKLGEQLKKVKITHQTMLKDSIALMRYGAEKHIKVDSNWYNSISLEGISKVYKDRYQDAGNFTFYIVGGVGKGRAKKLAQKYIGSISSSGRNEELVLLQNKLTEGREKRTYAFDIPGKQAGIIYNMDMQADNNTKNRLCFSMIQSYFQEQLHNEIRQKERGTYGVHVKNKLERYSTRNCNIKITFECATERAEELDDILHKTVVALCENGISQADFDIVKKKFDKPQRPPQKNNIYYVNMLKELVEMGTNNAEDDYYKKQLDSIDREYMNKMLKELIEKSAILDIVYVPE
jgi:zinc protease